MLGVLQVRVVDGTWEIAAALESWSVRYKEDNPDNPMSSYRLEGLSPATHYQVEITARNDIGWSDPSSQFVFMTESGKYIKRVKYMYLVNRLIAFFDKSNTISHKSSMFFIATAL